MRQNKQHKLVAERMLGSEDALTQIVVKIWTSEDADDLLLRAMEKWPNEEWEKIPYGNGFVVMA